MSSSAITTQVAQLKAGSIQNQADSSSIYSAGVWSFKNSTAVASVTISDAGNVGIGTASPSSYGHGGTNKLIQVQNSDTSANAQAHCILNSGWNSAGVSGMGTLSWALPNVTAAEKLGAYVGATTEGTHTLAVPNVALTFATRNTSAAPAERMRIDASGNLLVGTGSGAGYHTLVKNHNDWATSIQNSHASSPFGLLVRFTDSSPNNGSNHFLLCLDSTTTRMNVYSNGGIANYQGNNINYSDRRAKKDFAPAKSYLDTICKIPVQTFKYIDQIDEEKTLGVIAQDVQAVAPELVSEDNWGTAEEPKLRLAIYQTDLQYALMKCIQELSAKNEALEARLAALESK
jgi:hypothetical protein